MFERHAPSDSFPAFCSIRTLSGVGPKLEKLIAKVAGPRLVDLVLDLPISWWIGATHQAGRRPARWRFRHGASAGAGTSSQPGQGAPYRVIVSDDSATMELVFFRAHADYLVGILPVGTRRVVSGHIERFKDRLQMAHPDYVVPPEEIESFSLTSSLWPNRRLKRTADGQSSARCAWENAQAA